MFARLITVNVQPNKVSEFLSVFNEQVLPDASRESGFKGIYLMGDSQQSRITGLVLWETEADAQASVQGFMHQRLPKVAHLLTSPPAAETLEILLRA